MWQVGGIVQVSVLPHYPLLGYRAMGGHPRGAVLLIVYNMCCPTYYWAHSGDYYWEIWHIHTCQGCIQKFCQGGGRIWGMKKRGGGSSCLQKCKGGGMPPAPLKYSPACPCQFGPLSMSNTSIIYDQSLIKYHSLLVDYGCVCVLGHTLCVCWATKSAV